MDFRSEAADATVKRLGSLSGAALAKLGDSGCVPLTGGRPVQLWLAVSQIAVSLVCILCCLGMFLLSLMDAISRGTAMLWSLLILAVMLLLRLPAARILRAYLSSRPDSLLQAFENLPRRAVGLEDVKTYKKSKLVIEDSGVCLLDSERRRLLLEGCQYRYVLYAKDVVSVEPVSMYALSGARVNCRMGGPCLEFVLTAAGHGPLASLIQAFVPSEGAKGLATVLNRTLFGAETASYRQTALPPPLLGGAPPLDPQ